MSQSWQGDWQGRIYSRIATKGYSKVREFAAARPTSTIFELAAELGDDVAPVQMEKMMRAEALDDAALTWFARDYLVRCLHECIRPGWGLGENLDFRRAHAFGRWGAPFGDEFDSLLHRVWQRLRAANPPPEWLPAGPEDPFVVEAFRDIRFDAR